MSKAGPAVPGTDGRRAKAAGTLTCRPLMSEPFLPKGPRNCSATEETQVRAPSRETAQHTPVSQPPSVQTAEQQALTPIPAKIGAVDIEQFSRNLARLVEVGGRGVVAYFQ